MIKFVDIDTVESNEVDADVNKEIYDESSGYDEQEFSDSESSGY